MQSTKAQKLKTLLTKNLFDINVLLEMFDTKTLLMIQQASVSLEVSLECDKRLLTSIHVVAMVMNDIKMVQKNKKVIATAIRFKELNLSELNYN